MGFIIGFISFIMGFMFFMGFIMGFMGFILGLMVFRRVLWVWGIPYGFGGFHMDFIGCACRSRRRANIARSASFGLPDLAAAKLAAARAQWLAMSSRAWLLVESKPCKARYLPSLEQWLR